MRFPLTWIRDFVPLPDDIKLLSTGFTFSGTEVEEILESEGDIVFDFNFTVNRPDLMSIYGLAREASAVFDICSPKYTPNPEKSSLKIEDEISIEILDKDLCPRYRGLVIKGAKVGHSTPLIQKRLLQCGLRPINAVVDATNYVLLEYGHPLHAFDIKFIKGKKIIVRRARDGEIIKLLDGSEKKLSKEMLVIADLERPLAVAGIMGGQESGVSFLTRDILLEGAVFHPVSIRKTSKALNIHTDASHRFERGCDYEGPVKALDRVAELILEMCGGNLCQDELDIKTENKKIDKIILRVPQIKRILGIDIPKENIIKILDKLQFKIESFEEGSFVVSVPSFRVDIEREIDLIEEVIRVYGLDKLPVRIPNIVDEESGRNELQISEQKIRNFLSKKGLFEAVSFSMTDPYIDQLFTPKTNQIRISNPLSEANSVLRRSLLPNLLLAAKKNSSYGNKSFGFFEIGRTYFKISREEADSFDKNSLQDFHICENGEIVCEEDCLGILLYEEEVPKLFNQFYIRDIFTLKGIIEGLSKFLHKELAFSVEKPFSDVFSQNNFAKVTFQGKEIGFMSYLEPLKLRDFDIVGKVCVAELSLNLLVKREDPTFRQFSKYPASKRDISILVDNEVSWASIESSIFKTGALNLRNIELIEVYQDEKLGKEKKSITFSLYFQSVERTLSESEIEQELNKIIDSLKLNCNAVLR